MNPKPTLMLHAHGTNPNPLSYTNKDDRNAITAITSALVAYNPKKFTQAPAIAGPSSLRGVVAGSGLEGYRPGLKELLDQIKSHVASDPPGDDFDIVYTSHSRGGLPALELARILEEIYPNIRLNVLTSDITSGPGGQLAAQGLPGNIVKWWDIQPQMRLPGFRKPYLPPEIKRIIIPGIHASIEEPYSKDQANFIFQIYRRFFAEKGQDLKWPETLTIPTGMISGDLEVETQSLDDSELVKLYKEVCTAPIDKSTLSPFHRAQFKLSHPDKMVNLATCSEQLLQLLSPEPSNYYSIAYDRMIEQLIAYKESGKHKQLAHQILTLDRKLKELLAERLTEDLNGDELNLVKEFVLSYAYRHYDKASEMSRLKQILPGSPQESIVDSYEVNLFRSFYRALLAVYNKIFERQIKPDPIEYIIEEARLSLGKSQSGQEAPSIDKPSVLSGQTRPEYRAKALKDISDQLNEGADRAKKRRISQTGLSSGSRGKKPHLKRS